MARRARGLRDPETPDSPADKTPLLKGGLAAQLSAGDDDRYRWAKQITEDILAKATDLHRLLAEAKEGKAHEELGFGTWEDYVQTCFHFSRQRAHQLEKHNEVIRALEAAAGVDVAVPEGQTRGMHRVLDVVLKYMQEELERGVDPYVLVERVVAYFGRPNRKQAVAMSRVPGALSAMELQLMDTDDFNRHVDSVYGLMRVSRAPVPPEDFVQRLSEVERSDLERELATAQRWVAQAQKALAEAPVARRAGGTVAEGAPTTPKKKAAAGRRSTPPAAIRKRSTRGK